jgi:hypothetical protein
MKLDDVVADLLAGPLNDFTNRRNAKAKELKTAGQRELADQVTALKKPPVPVWAVNQLTRGNKAVLERLHEMGQGVVKAQHAAVSGRRNAAPELRSASDRLQRELEVAVRTVADRLRTDGHAADEATLRRVQEILRLGAVSGGDTWDRLRAGTLIDEPRAGEDMLTAAFALGAGAPGGSRHTERGSTARDSAAPTAREVSKQAAETEKRLALEHAQRTAKLDQEEAEQAAQTATRLREEANRMAADARRANDKARQAEKESESAAAQAKASQDQARKLGGRRA